MHGKPLISVIMPTFNRAAFIERAIESLIAQRLNSWELIVIDDGSEDGTPSLIERYMADRRIRLYSFDYNRGMGAALNRGLDRARARWVAYLPSDDVYYPEHLLGMATLLQAGGDAILAYSGVRYGSNRTCQGIIDGEGLQLVQVMHRKTPDRWMERSELVTDDLERMFWGRLRLRGRFAATNQVTCEWVSHPEQRHRILREPEGGINRYRVHFKVTRPLRFHTRRGNFIDEVELYRPFRDRADSHRNGGSLKILLVGELARNPERVLALEERGHRLYGLWLDQPFWYNTVGPVPFGHVEDIPLEGWRSAVSRIQPDVIYALLNWQAVPFANRILRENPGIPFVWHFNEGPFLCLEKEMWAEMVNLYRGADGCIYCSPEMQQWFHTVVPSLKDQESQMVLEGDLPKQEWFLRDRSPKLSDADQQVHTVVPGRPIGLHPAGVQELAHMGIHLHFYGDLTHGQWLQWIEQTKPLAPNHLHLHPHVDQSKWVWEFSRYDAGWLHFFESQNRGEIRRATWDDLNLPARMATLAAAGLPMLQRDNSNSIVAAQRLARERNLGLFFTKFQELSSQIRNRTLMAQIQESVWQQRHSFTFDAHADRLIAFFREVISRHSPQNSRSKNLCLPSGSTQPTTIQPHVS